MKIDVGTITRTIVLAIALFNQIMTATGHSILPIDDATVENLVSSIFTVVAAGVAWWKNNDITPQAQEGTKVMKELKKEGKTE